MNIFARIRAWRIRRLEDKITDLALKRLMSGKGVSDMEKELVIKRYPRLGKNASWMEKR